MRRIPPIDTRSLREKLQQVLFHPNGMSTTLRRELLVKYIGELEQEYPNGLCVNVRYCANTVKDKDLSALLKAGKLVTHRVHGYWGTNRTYVRVKHG